MIKNGIGYCTDKVGPTSTYNFHHTNQHNLQSPRLVCDIERTSSSPSHNLLNASKGTQGTLKGEYDVLFLDRSSKELEGKNKIKINLITYYYNATE